MVPRVSGYGQLHSIWLEQLWFLKSQRWLQMSGSLVSEGRNRHLAHSYAEFEAWYLQKLAMGLQTPMN